MKKFQLAVALGVGVAISIATGALACGPFFTTYYYTARDLDTIHSPQYFYKDLETFETAPYGVLRPEWRVESLYLVYRRLMNQPLSIAEKTSLAPYYQNFFTGDGALLENWQNAFNTWKDARSQVTTSPATGALYRTIPNTYNNFANCLPDAFLKATETLEIRKKLYSPEELQVWLKGQDAVFRNCDGANDQVLQGGSITESAQNLKTSFWSRLKSAIGRFFKNIFAAFKSKPVTNSTASTIPPSEQLAYDQDYQAAAAAFYRTDYTSAETKFKNIVDNLTHPWRALAALGLARTYAREGSEAAFLNTFGPYEAPKTPDTELEQKYNRTRQYAEEIMNDPNFASVKDALAVTVRIAGNQVYSTSDLLAKSDVDLASPTSTRDRADSLEDFSVYWNRYRTTAAQPVALDTIGSDFRQWLSVWTTNSTDPNLRNTLFTSASQKYHDTKSIPWLLASLQYLPNDTQTAEEFLNASRAIPQNSPAYLTSAYYRLQWFVDHNQSATFKKEFAAVKLVLKNQIDSRAEAYFGDLQMRASSNLKELLAVSQRKVVITGDTGTGDITTTSEAVWLTDKVVKEGFDTYLPLSRWEEVLNSSSLSENTLRTIGLVAFNRAIVVGDLDQAKRIALKLASGDSTLKVDLSEFINASNSQEQEFLATLFLLRYPRINTSFSELEDTTVPEFNWAANTSLSTPQSLKEIDNFRNNWWCARSDNNSEQIEAQAIFSNSISDQEIKKAAEENQKIAAETAPNFLAKVAVAYAESHPEDYRAAEALSKVVYASRYAACKDEATTGWSKKAFQTLHKLYPNSSWAENTQYWY